MIARKPATETSRREQVRTFAETIYRPKDVVEIRAIHHDRGGPAPVSDWCTAETLAKLPGWLEEKLDQWQEEGRGIFVGVNPRTEPGKTDAAGVACARCLFVDLDGGCTVAKAMQKVGLASAPEPTMIVESGGGTHLYWRLSKPLRGDDLGRTFRSYQKALIRVMEADAVVHDLPRVMRLPGFVNTKPDRDGAVVRIHEEPDPDQIVAWEEFGLEPFTEANAEAVAEADARMHEAMKNVPMRSRAELALRWMEMQPPARKIGKDETGETGTQQTWTFLRELCRGFALDLRHALPIARKWNERCQPPWDTAAFDRQVRNAIDNATSPPLGSVYSPFLEGIRQAAADDPDIAALCETIPEQTDAGIERLRTIEQGRLNGSRFPTEADVAPRFAVEHADRWRYCRDLGGWMAYDGRRWAVDKCNAVGRDATRFGRELEKEANDADRRKFARRLQTSSGAASMLRLAEPAAAERTDAFDGNPWLFACANCVIDMRTGEDRPHEPDDLLTVGSPVEYDPEARCPRFDAFLEDILPKPEIRNWVLQFFAWCMTGDVAANDVFVAGVGEGANGKSVLVDTIMRVLGTDEGYAVGLPETLLADAGKEHPTELMSLRGKRLGVASELEQGVRLRAARVKQLSGDDTITARAIQRDFVTFRRTSKLLLMTNAKPTIRDASDGLWRRLRVIPFDRQIPEEKRDGRLRAKLAAEASGILNRLLAAARDLRDQDWALGVPAEMQAAVDAYRKEENPIQAFLEERVVLENGCRVGCTELHKAYCEYVHEQHGSERPLGRKKFGEWMRRVKGVERSEHSVELGDTRAKAWLGCRLRDDRPEDRADTTIDLDDEIDDGGLPS